MRLQRTKRFIISGGGTGGHIFPAIAIANAIKELDPSSEILFVGAKGKMEMEKVPAAGYRIEGLWISGIQRKLTLDNLAFPFKLISSLWKSRRIIKKFKPDAVIGVGGFASGPLLYEATALKIPTLIQEQNSYPGITNRILAKRVKRICVAYEGMESYFPSDRILFTGNPVRKDILSLEGKRDEAFRFFGLEPGRTTVLIVGGSQGALSINRCILNNIEKLDDSGLQVLWQTGKSFYEQARVVIENQNIKHIKVFDFIPKMDLAYSVGDIVVSRAGASAVSELALVKKPCILIPFPFAAEDHQTKNASALVQKEAAILITDKKVEEDLVPELLKLASDQNAQQKLKNNISGLGMPDSAIVIAKEIFKLAGYHAA